MKPLFITIILFFGVTFSFGCECPVSPHKKEFRAAKAVFVGILLSIEDANLKKEGYEALPILTFEIEKSWKGRNKNQITVLADDSGGMCNFFHFQKNKKYLLYAYKREGYDKFYVTPECGSSKEFSSNSAQERIKDLDRFWFRLKSRLLIF